MVTIYADTLVCINMFITYFLLLATQIICRRPLKRIRILAASAVGGLYALTILLDPIPLWISIPVRVLFCMILLLIADRFRDIRQFSKRLFIFLLVNFLFAGLMLLLQTLRPERFLYSTGVLYFDVNIPFLLIATLCAYLIVQLVVRLSAGTHDAATQVTVNITMDEKAVQCVGIVDNGHRLRDPFNGQSVPIITSKIADKLASPDLQSLLHGDPLSHHTLSADHIGVFRLYPFHTVGAKGLLPAFRSEHIEVRYRNKAFEEDGIFIAVTDSPLFGGEADALIPQEIFDAMEEEKHAVQDHRHQSAVAEHPLKTVHAADPLHRHIADTSAAPRQERRSRRPLTSVRRR